MHKPAIGLRHIHHLGLTLDLRDRTVSTDDGAATQLCPLTADIARVIMQGGAMGAYLSTLRNDVPAFREFSDLDADRALGWLDAELRLVCAYVRKAGRRVWISRTGGVPSSPPPAPEIMFPSIAEEREFA